MNQQQLEAVRVLRLKVKAARALIRDLDIACARAVEALENAQPKEAQRDQENTYAAAL